MKKKYMPVTFTKDELNYFTLAIILKIINNPNKDPEAILFFREYYLGCELFIEEKYFLESIEKIKTALFEHTFNIEFRKPVTEFLDVLTNTIENGVKFVEPAEIFKKKLSPYYFQTL
jgi:hypothetical protein